MPTSIEDARTVEEHIDRIFSADGPRARAEVIRRLFVEVLDFHGAAGQVSLAGAAKGAELPAFAERIASLDGVHVLWVNLATRRVNKREAAEAARLIEQELGEDLLLVCTNLDENLGDADQFHLILPDFGSGTTPTLRRRTVERGLPQRTAFEQIAGIYSEDDPRPVGQALEKAFEVEPVTKSFFEEYRRIFEGAKELVSGFEDEEERHLFVQTLFNRLLFVHFLSRKGWLTFGDGEDRKDYLKVLWGDYKSSPGETNFYRDRLRRLFFDGLSNPESQFREYPDIGKVQFLNGGLFEETDLDKRAAVTVPNEAIEPVLRDLFDKFNFTVMESTPFDIEVAVDPEMLGKVFEELVTGRHESGSYYTPRPVVSFMCREALKGYLEGCETGLDAEAIRKFVDEHDESGIPHTSARAVGEALDEVTAVDPACGSGAYLLGMMQELIELWSVLYSDKLKTDARGFYELKLHIIERNLYGVDLDPFAVNVAMLRLWLSLAVEYEGEPPIPPLPNLDFKIVCGDSLLGADPSGLSLDRVTIEKSGLGPLKASYLRESNGDAKKQLRGEIEAAREQVRSDLGSAPVSGDVVDWRVEFAEVFALRGGFDIAIANPPYERQEQISGHKTTLKLRYPDVYTGTADYYVYFYNRAIQTLCEGGVLVFISSNKYMRANYGKKLRAHLSSSLTLSQVVDFGDLPVFTATAYPSIIVGRKLQADADIPLRVADLVMPIRRTVAAAGQSVTTETVNRAIEGLPALLSQHAVSGYPRSMLGEDGWVLEDIALVRIFERLMNTGTPLGEFVEGRIYYGIKSGLNEAFVIDQSKRDELVTADPRSAELLKPWLRGRDIKRWRADWRGQWLLNIPWHFPRHTDSSITGPSREAEAVFQSRYPAVYEHLRSHKDALSERNKAETGIRYEWYALQRWGASYHEEFAQPKIIFNRFISSPTFAWDASGFYHNDACYFAVPPTPSLAAIVNSQIGWWLLWHLCTMLQNGYFQVFVQFLERLPVPTMAEAIDHRLTELVFEATAGDATPALESEIDDLVAEAFGLTDRERTLIEEWFAGRSLEGSVTGGEAI